MNWPLTSARKRVLRETYGLTPDQWLALLEHQGYRCPGCRRAFTRSVVPVCDHRHASGRVRGALCSDCNYAIGLRHDNASWFRNIAEYLEHPPAPAVIGNVYIPHSPGAAGIVFEEETQ